jgi:hypothetical protein
VAWEPPASLRFSPIGEGQEARLGFPDGDQVNATKSRFSDEKIGF